jgi:hypothetical protein
MSEPEQVVRIVGGWSTECGSCKYGKGGWAASPAREGKELLSTDSPVCHGCGKAFTHELRPYESLELRSLEAPS